MSGLHGVLFALLAPSLPGRHWIGRGVWWGVVIWAMYWLFREWFIYVTLLGEPLLLAAFELVILLAVSLLECIVISGLCWRLGWVCETND